MLEPVLILTATINPQGMRYTMRSDPDQRRQDYRSAFERWLSSDFEKIVFCENSGGDLNDFQNLADRSGKQVDFISFEQEKFDERHGKGYGECLLIERALQSNLIDPEGLVCKVTGRLYLLSQARLVAYAKTERFDICMDVHRNLDSTDVRAFMAKPEFFTRYLLPLKDELNELVEPMQNLGRIAAQALHRAMADRMVWRPLPCSPGYVGFSGSHGHQYRPFKNAITRYFRMVLPPPGRFAK